MTSYPFTIACLDGAASLLLSGLIGAILGGGVCGLVTGWFIYWQSAEVARHNLRSVVVRMGVHLKQGKSTAGGDRGSEPWTVYMDEALSAYYRYRALLVFPFRQDRLDAAWKEFQGTDPNGDTPFAYRSLMIHDNSTYRITQFVNFLGGNTTAT
ncbi:hypothetical protein HZ994_09455 [Akkermansiaceae bacterium]|nr:hypothetical protein HZ994_09455 [Akkermansiaceae bacterium]